MKEQYIPSSEEVKKAEEMMSPEEKKMSEEREITYEAGKNKEKKRRDNFEWLSRVNESKHGGMGFFPWTNSKN